MQVIDSICHVAARKEDWNADREDGRRPQWRKYVPLFRLKYFFGNEKFSVLTLKDHKGSGRGTSFITLLPEQF